jgi:hypothetical protein
MRNLSVAVSDGLVNFRLLCLGSVAEKVGRSISRCALEDLLNGCSHLEV